jgi:hypothetical protein
VNKKLSKRQLLIHPVLRGFIGLSEWGVKSAETKAALFGRVLPLLASRKWHKTKTVQLTL